jgi:hypothetical protein
MVICHLPPRGVGIPRVFNSRAMALMGQSPLFEDCKSLA